MVELSRAPPCVQVTGAFLGGHARQARRGEIVQRPDSSCEPIHGVPAPSLRGGWTRRCAAAVAALVLGGILAPAAGDAAPTSRAARGAATNPVGDHVTLARLEARAAKLSRQYRGQLLTLSAAEADAKAATARALALRTQLDAAGRQIARLAVASYLSGGPNQSLALLTSGGSQQVLYQSEMFSYLARQRSAKERTVRRLLAASNYADRVAQAQIGRLSTMIAALEKQRHAVMRLLAKFHPQSPVIGPNVTPRMLSVKNAVDWRFGPFPSIGCWRPGGGDHTAGRACDFMLSTGGVMPTAAWIRKGYQVAAWAQANAGRLGIMYIIYRQHIWDIRMAAAGWVLMPDRGSLTANHYDHVHISVF